MAPHAMPCEEPQSSRLEEYSRMGAMNETTIERQNVNISLKLKLDPSCIDVKDSLVYLAEQCGLEVNTGSIVVRIPDMFESFMSTKPILNPHYEQVKAGAEDWILEILKDDPKICKAVSRAGFASYAAMSAPYGDAESLRIICDWGNWAFPFDDMFDFGDLKEDEHAAQAMMNRVINIMEPTSVDDLPTTPLLKVFVDIWDRISKTATKDIQERFKLTMIDYIQGTIEQVHCSEVSKVPSLEEFMVARRSSSAALTVIVLVEHAHRVEIPNEVYYHPCLEEMRRVVTDLVVIENDTLGYYKEQAEGVTHNLVNILRTTGLSIQEAFDHCGVLLRECYRDWYLTQAHMPQWGEEIDLQVQKYIESLKSFIIGNLNWHFDSDRYLGSMKTVARKHRIITVLNDEVAHKQTMVSDSHVRSSEANSGDRKMSL